MRHMYGLHICTGHSVLLCIYFASGHRWLFAAYVPGCQLQVEQFWPLPFFPIYYLNYMTCVRRKIYAVNHRKSSALPLCIHYGCYLDFFEDPPRYDCADWRSSCFHFICLYSLLNIRFSVSVIPGFGVLFHSMSWQISLFVFRRFLCWFLDSWRI
jgi:hypothetical protein